MRALSQAVLMLAALMVCGCAVQSTYIDTVNVLDESLYYYEQNPREKEKRAISEKTAVNIDPTKRKPTRVPHPALVDIDSTIHIQVDKDHLSLGTDEGFLRGRSTEFRERKEGISRALVALEEVIVARQEAIKAYHESDNDFLKLRRKLGAVRVKLNKQLIELWPEGTTEYNQLTDLNKKKRIFDPPKFVKLQKFLQERIQKIEEEDRAITKELKKERMASLRLEAFLDQGDDKNFVAIHLKGYDYLETGKLKSRDRFGLDLSPKERVRLAEQVSATLKLADKAERVRREEISLRDALRETVPVISPRLNQLMKKVESLESKLDKEPLNKRLDEAKELFKAFVEEVEQKAKELAKRIEDDLEKMPQSYRAFLEKESGPYVEALALYAGLKQLEERWSTATELESILVMDSLRLAGDLRSFFQKLKELKAEDFEAHLTRFLKVEFSGIMDDASGAFMKVAYSEAANKLRAHIEELYEDLQSVREIAEEGIKFLETLGELEEQEIALGTHVPESLKVPLGDVQDTFIKLERTPRLAGDTITVRATLYYKDKKDLDVNDVETTASFQVEKFGWFAELSPAVVLVKPDELKGGNESFSFAPTLSWMHQYAPRPEDSMWYAAFLRGFQPALGMHSAFLSFNPDGSGDAIQVGLGATVSFWKNRLQFGAGYNLMANTEDEGRYYYFVGTDLIGLLQTIGIGK